MLVGTKKVRLTQGNRLVLPRSFRGILGNKLYISNWIGNFWDMYSYQSWSNLLEEIEMLSQLHQDVRSMQRRLFASTEQIDLDKQGRFQIPSFLLESLGSTVDVSENTEFMMIGIADRLEVWHAKLWEINQSNKRHDPDQVSERLAFMIDKLKYGSGQNE